MTNPGLPPYTETRSFRALLDAWRYMGCPLGEADANADIRDLRSIAARSVNPLASDRARLAISMKSDAMLAGALPSEL